MAPALSTARPASRLLTTLLPSLPTHHGLLTTRSHQLAARTKRALRIRPHASHLLRTDPAATQDEIAYNPPAALPTVYNTPFKFLPRTDPRRSSNLQVLFAKGSPAQQAQAALAASVEALPAVGHSEEKRYHVTPDQVREMRALRMADPRKWTLNRLARKFDCSAVFVKRATTAPQSHIKQLMEKIEMRRARWGAKKAKAKEDAKKRKDMLFRGEL